MKRCKLSTYICWKYICSYIFYLLMVSAVILNYRVDSGGVINFAMIFLLCSFPIISLIGAYVIYRIKQGSVFWINISIRFADIIESGKKTDTRSNMEFTIGPFMAGLAFHYLLKIAPMFWAFILGMAVWALIVKVLGKWLDSVEKNESNK